MGRIALEASMRSALAVTTALLLLPAIGMAEAADSALFAETGGFLLGNAHRCGVPTERVEHVGKVIHNLIVAAAHDPSEAAAADSRFAEIFLASAVPGPDWNALRAPCTVVITQFDRLERHYREAEKNGGNRIGRSGFEDSLSSE
jgi:hypothetical protein